MECARGSRKEVPNLLLLGWGEDDLDAAEFLPGGLSLGVRLGAGGGLGTAELMGGKTCFLLP